MLDRESCERRVYRLAVLLTGRQKSAVAVIEQVVGARPDLQSLDSEHMDRLTVLRSREQAGGALKLPGLDAAVASAIAELPSQQREAWIFISLYQLDDRTAAKAMDCSFRAARQHHDLAVEKLREHLGARLEWAAKSVREAMMRLDVPEFYRARQRTRKKIRRTLLVLAIIAAILTTLVVVLWVMEVV